MTDPALNAATAEVMGWTLSAEEPSYNYWVDSRGVMTRWDAYDWQPSTDVSHAMLVADRMRELGWTLIIHGPGSESYCDGCKTFAKPTAIFDKAATGEADWDNALYQGRHLRAEASAESVARAICLAALLAHGSREG